MTTNNYFNANYKGALEQTLINKLHIESIQQQGYDMVYMPRENANFDYLFGEDPNPKYDKTYIIEAYIKDVTGFTGAGQIISSVGLDVQDEITVIVSIDRFKEVVTAKQEEIIRPKEGDIMFFDMYNQYLMEVTYVENKTPFLNLGALYLYEISLRRLVYGSQAINTGIEEIDIINSYGDVTRIELGAYVTGAEKYIQNEMVYQLNPDLDTYRASATVLSHDNGVLVVHDVFGTFVAGVNITGEVSTATYQFPVKNDTTYDDLAVNPISDNKEINGEVVDVVDQQETNPFVDF